MFSNLKKKIQKEGGFVGAEGSPTGPGTATQLVRRGSNSSFGSLQDLRDSTKHNGITEEKLSVHQSPDGKDDPVVQLSKRTDQCKKLEAKISELAASIKEKNKQIERLNTEADKRDHDHRAAIEDLRTKQDESETVMREMFQESIKRKEEEIRSNYIDLVRCVEKENKQLKAKVSDAENFKTRILRKEEETEEMQDFTNQELAKVKHMLLNTQSALAKAECAVKEKDRELTQVNKRLADLETHIETLNIEIAHHKNENEKFDDSRHRVNSEIQNLRNKVSNYEAQINQLKAGHSELTENFSEKSSSMSTLEEAHANLLGEHQMLQRNSEVYKNKTVATLEEKQEEIRHLQERVETLEQRVQDCDLIGDDQTEAIKAERDALEQKLTEIRQQLLESKLQSTERISHLEDQISHLNTKMLEDSEELTMNERSAENMRENFQAQLDELQTKLSEAEQRALTYAETISEKDILHEKEILSWELEMKKLRQYSSATERELEEKVRGLETRLSGIGAEHAADKSSLVKQISDFEKSRDIHLAKEMDSESRITRLEREKTEIQSQVESLEKNVAKLTSQLDDKQRELTSSGIDKSSLTEECNNLKEQVEHLQKSLKTKQTHYTECSREKDSLLLRNAELSQQMENVRRTLTAEKRDLETEMTGLRDQIANWRKEYKDMKEKCEDLESERNMVMVNIESAEVSRLKETVDALEQQITEKNKTVKVQQQRLADLKKTLQRELKVQSFPDDAISDSRPIRDQNAEQLDTRLATSKPANQSPTPVRNHVTSSANQSVDMAAPFNQTSGPCTMTSSTSCSNASHVMSDVNLCYLKNVLLKFLLSRESESLHLIKAISTLLKFTREEQRLLRETLEYKMSWFPVRKPSLGRGQHSKAIPPSW